MYEVLPRKKQGTYAMTQYTAIHKQKYMVKIVTLLLKMTHFKKDHVLDNYNT